MAYLKMQDVLEELLMHNMRIFSINDAVRIMEKSRAYVSKQLSKNKKVLRIERGKYYIQNNNGIDMYEIASNIAFPSYVSMFSAFQYYSITEQSVIRYSVITIKRHRPIEIMGNVIEFITMHPSRFFGYAKMGNSYVATPEKAIIDSLYTGYPSISYVEEAFSAAIRDKLIDKKRLIKTANLMGSKTVNMKLRKLFKENGLDVKDLGA